MLREAIRRLSGHTATYAAAEQVARLAGFLLVPLWTTYLSLADFGTREILTVTLVVLSQAAGVNVVAAMARLYYESADPARRKLVISTTFWAAGASAALFAALVWATTPLVVRLLPSAAPDLPRLLHLALGIFVFQTLREVQTKALQTQERSRTYVSFALSKLALEIGLQVVFLVVLGRGLAGLLEAVLLSEALFALLLAPVVLGGSGLRFSRPVLAGLAAFTLPLIPNGLLQFCLHQADRYLLGWLVGEEAVGMYGFAYKFGQLPNFVLLGPFLLIWYPYVFSLRDEARQREVIERLSPYLMALMTGLALGVSLFARELTVLMAGRPSYHPAWVAIPPVALGYWFWALFQLLQTGFFVRKSTGALPAITAVAVVANVLVNLLLVPRLGALGAALATLATFALLAFLTHRRGRAIFPLAMPWRRLATPLAGALVAFAAALVAAPWIGPWAPLLKLLLGLSWLAWAWGGGLLDAEERAAGREALAALPARLRRAASPGAPRDGAG